MHIESNNALNDSDKIMAIAGLFKGHFSIDWFIDLLTEKKPSQIYSAGNYAEKIRRNGAKTNIETLQNNKQTKT